MLPVSPVVFVLVPVLVPGCFPFVSRLFPVCFPLDAPLLPVGFPFVSRSESAFAVMAKVQPPSSSDDLDLRATVQVNRYSQLTELFLN